MRIHAEKATADRGHDSQWLSQLDPNADFSDPMHFSRDGSRRFAKHLAPAVVAALARSP